MARRPAAIKIRAKKKAVRVGKKGIVVANSTNTTVKDLKPKDTDVIHYGPEPNFSDKQPNPERRESELGTAYSWYSHFYGPKEAKAFIIQYLEDTNADKEVIKLVRKAPDNRTVTTAGWVARCATRGLVLEQKNIDYIQRAVNILVDFAKRNVKDDTDTETETKPKRTVNIQEVMREKADEALSDVEALFDEFIDANCPKDFNVDKRVVGALSSKNVLPQHIAPAIKRYQRLLDEYIEVQGGKCEQLNEGYSNYSKMQIRYTIKFIEDVIAEMNGYISLKQATKKPRAKKAVPVEKVVARLKYCRAFKDDALKIDLTGLSPVKLHQSTEAWVYDTKKRKMHHYVADNYSKCLMVKGNTVIGFDKKESGMKTLRKPAEQIAALMGSKPAARKYFKEIKAVEAVPNGRFNADMIILKAF
jgi:hypothetical protein